MSTAELRTAEDIPNFWASPAAEQPLTPEELAEIEAGIPAIYGAPWTTEPGTDEHGHLVWHVRYATDNPDAGLVATLPDYAEHLAEFTAAARTNVPRLLREVKRLRAEAACHPSAASVPA